MTGTADGAGAVSTHSVIDLTALGRLIESLQTRGYQVVGPQIRDSAIVYDTLERLEDLPVGWQDDQAPGRYRVAKNGASSVFGYAVGPHSWKKYLNPPEVRLTRAEGSGQEFRILGNGGQRDGGKHALIGVRPCDLAAISIQDRVFMGDRFTEPEYAARRNGLFVVAVQCTRPSASCFCTSMNTGPLAKHGFDLALTEVTDGESPSFVVETGSEAGAEVLADLKPHKAAAKLVRQAEETVKSAAASISRRIDTRDIRELLYQNFEHARWDDVAARCLSCGNCTMACPTCFCSTVEDSSDVAGRQAERWRRWDSCFVQSFSYIHGGSVRMSARSRYRQWLTHKLAAWIDQFGTSGCVGCGRCITWCPVGIDITQEVAAIRGGMTSIAGGERPDEERNTRDPARAPVS
jgi:sulfhydrogenase subunit beta (sulfur reductase)